MKWIYINHEELNNPLSVTDDMLEQWRIEYLERDKINKDKYYDLSKIKERIIDDATTIYGKDSNVVRYINKQKIPKPFVRSFRDVKNIILKAREQEQKRLKEIEFKQGKNILIEKAVNYLIEDGLKLSIDFTIDDAISRANNISFIKEVSKRQQEGGYFSFSGDDSCEDCIGWDGVSRRCECGNRRVSWESHGDDNFFLDPYIFGEAY